MPTNSKREQHVDHALTTTRLSGIKPSAKFIELADQYKEGIISSEQLTDKIKEHYRKQPTSTSKNKKGR